MQSKFKILITCFKLLIFTMVLFLFCEATITLGEEFKSCRHPSDNALMVKIPEGYFTMGSNEYSNEKPLQKIYLDSFWIDEYPVTNAQFQKFIEASGYKTDAEKAGAGLVQIGIRFKKIEGVNWKIPDGTKPIENDEYYPVIQVSHNDALAYCQWSKKTLPTEAQWEKAARGPNGNEYPWGNDKRSHLVAFGFMPTPDEPFPTTRSFYGIRYISAIFKEWCRDWYGTDHREAKNPTGPHSGMGKVVKGYFRDEPEGIRCSKRGSYFPSLSSTEFTFRCVCEHIDGVNEQAK